MFNSSRTLACRQDLDTSMNKDRTQQNDAALKADMAYMQTAIGRARGLRELLPLVIMLSRETEAIISDQMLSESDIQQIAAPLSKIRILLAKVAAPGRGQNGFRREDALVAELADRYLDIEGRIKEMRNDLALTKKTRVP